VLQQNKQLRKLSYSIVIEPGEIRERNQIDSEVDYFFTALSGKYSDSEIQKHYQENKVIFGVFDKIEYRLKNAKPVNITESNLPQSTNNGYLPIATQSLEVLITELNKYYANYSTEKVFYYLHELRDILSAKAKSTSPKSLRKLFAENTSDRVREHIASNLNTPADLLDQLSEIDNYAVQLAIAKNVNTPVATLKKHLLNNKNYDIRQAAEENINHRGK
jgi:hypothetical protein